MAFGSGFFRQNIAAVQAARPVKKVVKKKPVVRQVQRSFMRGFARSLQQ